MAERWAIERAVRDAECPLSPTGRHLILTLLTWTDHSTAVIPAQFSPSLTDLERATGMARSTIAVRLNQLEELGWVVRLRPKVDEARRKKARTAYRLRIPPMSPTGPATEPALVRQPDRLGPTTGRDSNTKHRPTAGASTKTSQRHPYIQGANGYCAFPDCGKSAPLH
ncbi:helix-turn-helix domain-containing protein [Micromonospora sp. NPDC051141]|uniref:helix-turn-helix domain-containing protein n=1 Tax=Micromonospora sp. NPDC051141 TaxID=3364284 RepID=UPI0037895D3C